jgi:hypothetical protein
LPSANHDFWAAESTSDANDPAGVFPGAAVCFRHDVLHHNKHCFGRADAKKCREIAFRPVWGLSAGPGLPVFPMSVQIPGPI